MTCLTAMAKVPIANQSTLFGLDTGSDCQDDKSQTLKRLRIMTEVLPDVGFMTACVGLLYHEKWLSNAQVKYFTGPVIFGKTEWSSSLPSAQTQKLVKAVRLERFWQLLDEVEQGKESEQCVPAELVCAIQPYTLVAPLSPDYRDACVWAFAQVLERHPTLFPASAELRQTFPTHLRTPDPYVLREFSTTLRRRVVARGSGMGCVAASPEGGNAEAAPLMEPEQVQMQLF